MWAESFDLSILFLGPKSCDSNDRRDFMLINEAGRVINQQVRRMWLLLPRSSHNSNYFLNFRLRARSNAARSPIQMDLLSPLSHTQLGNSVDKFALCRMVNMKSNLDDS